MPIETLPVGQMQANCYLLFSEKSKETCIVDPGDDADFIINKISDLGLKPKCIVATHGHFDHIMAVTELKLAYKIPFYANRGDLAIINRMGSTALYFTKIESGPSPKAEKFLRDEDEIKIGNLKLKVLATPGHTPGSLCFYEKDQNWLFSGDTIFADGNYGRTDLAGGNSNLLMKSIVKILELPDDVVIYPGHGLKSSIKKEKFFYRYLNNIRK